MCKFRFLRLTNISESSAQTIGILVTLSAFIFSVYQFYKNDKHRNDKFDYDKQIYTEENHIKSLEKAVENLKNYTISHENCILPYFDSYKTFRQNLLESFLQMECSTILLLDGASGKINAHI